MEVTLTDISPEVQRAKQRFGIAGNSAVLIAAIQRAVQVAPIDLSVLVTGESGTGKEFFPQIIHAYSARKHSRYIAVNCGAIPEGTIDSELFGHEKGAFTGAVASRKGYFEEADGGTIFLDEVAELPLTTQARLLRVLESGEFIRVGSSEVQKTNIRVVAATNVDMLKAVAEGKFREDLYYRLSTVMISVPPLRDRGNDVALLARKFSADFAERYRIPQITFDDTARRLLMQYRWPGNVRQLKNVVEQAALFEAGRTLSSSDLEPYLPSSSAVYTPVVTEAHHNYGHERDMLFNMIFRLQSELDSLRREVDHLRTSAPATPPLVEAIEAPAVETETAIVAPAVAQPTSTHLVPYSSTTAIAAMQPHSAPQVATLEETEKETIRRSLRKNDGRRKATAKELNISERTLYRKIKEYGLDD